MGKNEKERNDTNKRPQAADRDRVVGALATKIIKRIMIYTHDILYTYREIEKKRHFKENVLIYFFYIFLL